MTSRQAAAQQWSFYGQGTGAELKLPNTGHVYGPAFGLFRSWNYGPVAIGYDVRVSFDWRASKTGAALTDQRLDTGLVGFRVSTNSHMPKGLTPYAEGLIGAGYIRGGLGVTRVDKHGSALEAVAGLDYKVTRSFSWRVAEYGYTRDTTNFGAAHPQQISTGIIWHP